MIFYHFLKRHRLVSIQLSLHSKSNFLDSNQSYSFNLTKLHIQFFLLLFQHHIFLKLIKIEFFLTLSLKVFSSYWPDFNNFQFHDSLMCPFQKCLQNKSLLGNRDCRSSYCFAVQQQSPFQKVTYYLVVFRFPFLMQAIRIKQYIYYFGNCKWLFFILF